MSGFQVIEVASKVPPYSEEAKNSDTPPTPPPGPGCIRILGKSHEAWLVLY